MSCRPRWAAERPGEAWDSPFEAAVKRDAENVQAALSTVDRSVIAEVVRTLAAARKTVVLSAGSYAAVGHILVDKLNVMGYDACLERKQSEGKTRREAIRCLKRQLARTVYTTLKNEPLLT